MIRHPLDRFAFNGTIGHLDSRGTEAADQIMTLISDMRFSKDNIRGTCARYFVLVDLSWFPELCFAAHINCVKLREYLWRVERGAGSESENTVEDVQAAFPF